MGITSYTVNYRYKNAMDNWCYDYEEVQAESRKTAGKLVHRRMSELHLKQLDIIHVEETDNQYAGFSEGEQDGKL